MASSPYAAARAASGTWRGPRPSASATTKRDTVNAVAPASTAKILKGNGGGRNAGTRMAPKALRRYQVFVPENWLGGLYGSSGLPGPAGNRESFLWLAEAGREDAVSDLEAAARRAEP